MMVSGGIGAFFIDATDLNNIKDRKQPPHIQPLQAVLQNPAPRLQPLEEDVCGRSGVLTGFGVNAQDSSITFRSTPKVTAVLGDTYTYRIEVESENEVTLEIMAAPGAARIDQNDGRSGLLSWIPEPESERKVAFCLSATDATYASSLQAFEVFVGASFYPLGTDEHGRDVLTALAVGAKWAIFPGLLAVFIAMGLGVALGGYAGYYEGLVSSFLYYLSSVTESLPVIVILFIGAVWSASVFDVHIWMVMAILGFLWFPQIAAFVRTSVQRFKGHQFVEAARELGLSDSEILWAHIIWHNLRYPLLLKATQLSALSVAIEVTLSYLNLGVKHETTWGAMMRIGQRWLYDGDFWLLLMPVLALLTSIAAFQLISSGIQKRIDHQLH